jgi:hypothetical protein
MLASYELMCRGYQVFRAISPSSTCDLLAMKDGKILRVEVTKGKRRGDNQWLYWGRHDSSRYDMLIVWEEDGCLTINPPKEQSRRNAQWKPQTA